jgi:hypothetical protein
MVRERNTVSITGKISDGLSKFESYNNKEIYRFDQLGFTITGRLVSGLSGFLIIVVMLMFTFSSAANSIMVSDLGGSKSFVGDVVVVEETGTSLPENSLSPGQSVDFGYLVEDTQWDYINNSRLSHVEVIVDWEANGVGSVGNRQVTLQASTQNDTTGKSEIQSGFDGTIMIQFPVQMLPETVSGTADSSEAFVEGYETEGEWIGGTFTYDSGSTITSDNSISYTISLKIYTWELENVRELSEI